MQWIGHCDLAVIWNIGTHWNARQPITIHGRDIWSWEYIWIMFDKLENQLISAIVKAIKSPLFYATGKPFLFCFFSFNWCVVGTCVCVVLFCLYPLPGVPGIWFAASWAQENQTHCCLLYDERVPLLLHPYSLLIKTRLSSCDLLPSVHMLLISIASTLSTVSVPPVSLMEDD